MSRPTAAGAAARARRGGSAGAAILLALLGGARATPAAAQSPAPASREMRLDVVAPTCPSVPFDLAAFVSILRAEVRAVPYRVRLAPPGATAGEGGAPVLALETVPCDPATATVEATYRGPQSGRRIRLSVDLADVGADARPRVLSLVLAELLRDDSIGPRGAALTAPSTRPPSTTSSERAAAPPEAPPAAQTGRPPPPSEPSAWRLGARIAADARAYHSFDVPLVGGRIGASGHATALPLRAVIDLMVLSGSSNLAFGSVDTRAVIAAVGIDWTSGSSAGRIELAVGPRLEGGWGWLAGRAADASVRAGHLDAPLGGLSLAGSIAAHLTHALAPFIELEAGLTLAETVGLSNGSRAAGFAGAWASARVGMEVEF